MAQSVDISGLNTFLYEPCGWYVDDPSSGATLPTGAVSQAQGQLTLQTVSIKVKQNGTISFENLKTVNDGFVSFDHRLPYGGGKVNSESHTFFAQAFDPKSITWYSQQNTIGGILYYTDYKNKTDGGTDYDVCDDQTSDIAVCPTTTPTTYYNSITADTSLGLYDFYDLTNQPHYYQNSVFTLDGQASGTLGNGGSIGDNEKPLYFTALMLRRNGMYGWPTWKQIRASHNHLIRKQRKHNIFTYVQEPGEEFKTENSSFASFRRGRRSSIKVFEEVPITSKYKPLELAAGISDTEESRLNPNNPPKVQKIKINTTYGNETCFFANSEIDKYFNLQPDKNRNYERVTQMYLKGALDSPSSPIDMFEYLKYSEVVYPSMKNTYRDHIRTRPNFIFSWRSALDRRIQPGTSKIDHGNYASYVEGMNDNGFGFLIPYQSLWPLDSAWNHDDWMPAQDGRFIEDSANPGNSLQQYDDYIRQKTPRPSLSPSSSFIWPIGGSRQLGDYSDHPQYSNVETSSSYNWRLSNYLTDSAGGEGQLMNSYCLFSDYRQVENYWGTVTIEEGGIDRIFSASCLYARRHVIPSRKSIVPPSGMDLKYTGAADTNEGVIDIYQSFGGSTKWEAPETRKILDAEGNYVKQSKYPFYDTYDKFAEYTKLVGKDFSIVPEFRISEHISLYEAKGTTEQNLDIFEITGGLTNNSDGSKDNFYKIYSNSDFLKHFEIIKKDHDEFVEPAAISLKCKAIKKFLPYDGFYPSQRTLQLGKQFYDSYGQYFSVEKANIVKSTLANIEATFQTAKLIFFRNQFSASFHSAPSVGAEFGTDWKPHAIARASQNPKAQWFPSHRQISSFVDSPTPKQKFMEYGSDQSNIIHLNKNASSLSESGSSPYLSIAPNGTSHSSFEAYLNIGAKMEAPCITIGDYGHNFVTFMFINAEEWDNDYFPSGSGGNLNIFTGSTSNETHLKNWMAPVYMPEDTGEWEDSSASALKDLKPIKVRVKATANNNPSDDPGFHWSEDLDLHWEGWDQAQSNIQANPTATPDGDYSGLESFLIFIRVPDTDTDEDQSSGLAMSTREHGAYYAHKYLAEAITALNEGPGTLADEPSWDPASDYHPELRPIYKAMTFHEDQYLATPRTYYDASSDLVSRKWGVKVTDTKPAQNTTFTANVGPSGYTYQLDIEYDSESSDHYDRNSAAIYETPSLYIANWCCGIVPSVQDPTDTFDKSYTIWNPVANYDHSSLEPQGQWTAYSARGQVQSTELFENENYNSKYAKTQPLLTPLFAPGVLFNTIKSGIACDYPLMTENIKRVLADVSDSVKGTNAFWMIGCRGTQTSSFALDGDIDFFNTTNKILGIDTPAEGQTAATYRSLAHSDFKTYDITDSEQTLDSPVRDVFNSLALKDNLLAKDVPGFDYRIPFEALIEPENFLAGRTFINQEPDNFLYFNEYVRLEYKTKWSGQGDMLYKKMAHNFLAEVPDFFLDNGHFKKIQSLPQSNPNFGNVQAYTSSGGVLNPYCYKMRVKVYRSLDKTPSPIWSNGVYVDPPQDYIPFRPGFEHPRETLTMYSRPSAFGPPSWDGDFKIRYLGSSEHEVTGSGSRYGYNFPFTPPYYHGEAWADITFKPTEIKKYSLSDIINSCSVDYYRYWHPYANLAIESRQDNTDFDFTTWTGSLAVTDSVNGNHYAPQHPLFINDNAMHLNASLNLFGKTIMDPPVSVGPSAAGPTMVTVDTIQQNEAKWIIQPKFETPILNFGHLNTDGTQSIFEIKFHSKTENQSDWETITASIDITSQRATESDYGMPNIIRLYDGDVEYNVWFSGSKGAASTGIYPPNSTDGTSTGLTSFPKLVSVDIDAVDGDNYFLADAFRDAINNKTTMIATTSSLTTYNNYVWVTPSFHGVSKPPEYDTNEATDSSGDGVISENVLWQNSFRFVTRESGSSPDITLSRHSPETTTIGMWHQYGLVPTGSDGVFMRIEDIPSTWQKGALGVHGGYQKLTASLADLVGFSKEPVRLGEIANTKEISEAVIAVPFIVDNNERKFFEIPRRDIDNALESNPSVRTVGQSIIDMVQRMKKYVFPPSMDFLRNEDITPFAMYIFEFSHTLNRQDLIDIWQNLPPDVGTTFETATATITHKLLSSELIGGGTKSDSPSRGVDSIFANDGIKFKENMQWMVFKAKRRAKTNYYDKVVKKAGVAAETLASQLSKVSYNWPYDFFSLIELVKLESSVVFAKPTPTPGPELAPVRSITNINPASLQDFALSTLKTPEIMNSVSTNLQKVEVARRFISAIHMTRITYSDGTEEFVNGDQT